MTPKILLAASAPLALALSACSDGNDNVDAENSDVADLNAATTDGEAAMMAAQLEAGDFADLQLGAKIVGPQGPEPSGSFTNAAGSFGDIVSYVACPEGMDPCDPKTAPEGTVFTYVHKVFPGEDNDPSTGSGRGADASDVERASGFRMTMPAHGFTGSAGYSKAEVIAAVGPKADVSITCDDGALVWTVNAGDGGNQWEQAEPVTFWWQSTLPPAGPAEAYRLDANYAEATGPGPYPGARDGAVNACTDKSTAG